jgi:hypothetical protein
MIDMFGTSQKSRVLIVAGLAVLSVVLGILAVVLSPHGAAGREPERKNTAVAVPGEAEIRRGLEAVCAEFKVPPASLKVRDVKNRAGDPVRVEYRLRLPKDFSSVEFNHALADKVEPWGARVVGTERTHDRTVTLHVVRDEETIMSVILDMNEPTKAGKDHGK